MLFVVLFDWTMKFMGCFGGILNQKFSEFWGIVNKYGVFYLWVQLKFDSMSFSLVWSFISTIPFTNPSKNDWLMVCLVELMYNFWTIWRYYIWAISSPNVLFFTKNKCLSWTIDTNSLYAVIIDVFGVLLIKERTIWVVFGELKRIQTSEFWGICNKSGVFYLWI